MMSRNTYSRFRNYKPILSKELTQAKAISDDVLKLLLIGLKSKLMIDTNVLVSAVLGKNYEIVTQLIPITLQTIPPLIPGLKTAWEEFYLVADSQPLQLAGLLRWTT